MADAGAGGRREHRDAAVAGLLARLDGVAQVGEVADCADGVEPFLPLQRDAGGVVTAIFELLQAGEDDLLRGALARVSHDPAHGRRPFL